MTTPAKVEGVDYSVDGIMDIRLQLINARNGAMNQQEFNWAVIFTHAIALLSYLAELEGGTIESFKAADYLDSESAFISKLHARLVADSEAPDHA